VALFHLFLSEEEVKLMILHISGDFKVQILTDVFPKVQPSLFHQLHHRKPGEKLSGGADSKQGFLRVYGNALFNVLITIAFTKDHLSDNQIVEENRQILRGQPFSCSLLGKCPGRA